VILQKLSVPTGVVSLSVIGGVALYYGTAYMIDDRLPEFRLQKILIALFSGVDFDSNFAGKCFFCHAVQLQYLFRGDLTGKINLDGIAHNNTPLTNCVVRPVYHNTLHGERGFFRLL
jgi:hypothetical protein